VEESIARKVHHHGKGTALQTYWPWVTKHGRNIHKRDHHDGSVPRTVRKGVGGGNAVRQIVRYETTFPRQLTCMQP